MVYFVSGAFRDGSDVAFRCLTHFAVANMSDESCLSKKQKQKKKNHKFMFSAQTRYL